MTRSLEDKQGEQQKVKDRERVRESSQQQKMETEHKEKISKENL